MTVSSRWPWRAAKSALRRPPPVSANGRDQSGGHDETKRLHFSVDTPADGDTLVRGRNVVGGWTFHEGRAVAAILVLVDGKLVATVAELAPRPDVGVVFPQHPSAARAGWTATFEVDRQAGDEVEVAVYVALAPVAPSRRRWGPLLLLASMRCTVQPLRGGYFVEVDELRPGYQRIWGAAVAPGGVSSVDILCDGREIGRARTGLAGHFDGSLDDGGAALDTFEVAVEIPAGQRHARLTGVVNPVVGDPFPLRPWDAAVVVPDDQSWDPRRLETVRERATSRLDRRRSGAPGGDAPRVFVMTHDLGIGGGQLYLQELLLRLHRRGVHLAVASPRGGRLVDELEKHGIEVLVTGGIDPYHAEAYESQVERLASWAVDHGCQVALVNTMSAFAGADAATRLGLPVVWAIHDSFHFGQYWMEAFSTGVQPYVVERAAHSLRAADSVVFEAQATLDLYTPWLQDGAGIVVPYGVDLDEIDDYLGSHDRESVRAALGIADSTIVLLCMGTVEPRKAQVNLALAFAGSESLAGADVLLVFVGGREAAYDDLLIETIVAYDEQRIHLEPVQPDVQRWYLASDILVCASDVESLPRSMLEEMAFGRPVASTAVFGIPELVDDGVTGFLCEPRDLLALRRMLERVHATGAEGLRAMGERAREVARSRHDPAVYEQYYLDRLTTLAGDLSPRRG